MVSQSNEKVKLQVKVKFKACELVCGEFYHANVIHGKYSLWATSRANDQGQRKKA